MFSFRRATLVFASFVLGTAAALRADTKLLLAKQTLAKPVEAIEVTVPAGERVAITFPILSGNVWLKNDVPLPNADGRTLVIESARVTDAGRYRVMYTSSHPIDSQELILNVAGTFAAPPASPRLLTFTTRGIAGAGNQALVSGFVVGEIAGRPHAKKQILVRAVGPTLAEFGVANALAAPVLTVFDQQGQPCTPTVEGLTVAQISSGAYPLKPGGRDVVLLFELPAGAYTAQVTSADATIGAVLLEIYDVPVE
jgi:hypothetical protein